MKITMRISEDFRSTKFVGNKTKGRISKRLFQENKARQIFRKMKISYPMIHTRTCAYQGVRNVRFLENLLCFVFLLPPLCDLPFCLTTDDLRLILPSYRNQSTNLRYWFLRKYSFKNLFSWIYSCCSNPETLRGTAKLHIFNILSFL